ncbi:MAG TPA: ABC transporter ATP-binding protein [Burkholderiaceae bacterium]|nr:ABC transporter ATP-binding protein [Burkholderiaceae bacterium]
MLEVDGLWAGYGKFGVLEDVSFTVAAGRFLGILGRNGVGKTTLLKAVAGPVRPGRGAVRFEGRPIHQAQTMAISRMGIALVLDRKGIFRNLTVRDNLVLARRLHPAPNPRWTIEGVLTLFPRLAERSDAPGGGLSGGEQQMLAIARALMTQPRLMLFDEPTEGLAPKIVDELVVTLQRLRAEGLTAIVVDQRLETVFDTCDETLVMSRGRIALRLPTTGLRERVGELEEHLGV